MHVKLEYKRELKCMPNPGLEQILSSKMSEKEKVNQVIQNLQLEDQEIQREQQQLTSASAKFAYFLQCNAIATVNDGLEEYVSHQIRELENNIADLRAQRSPHVKKVESLKSSLEDQLRKFEHERRILEDTLSRADASTRILAPKDVQLELNNLLRMKHIGPELMRNLQVHEETERECQSKNRQVHVEMPKSQSQKANQQRWWPTWQECKSMAGF